MLSLHFLIQIIDAAKNSIFFIFIIVSCCYFFESKGTLLFRNMQENRGKSFRKSYCQGSGVCGQGEMDKKNCILLLAIFSSVPQFLSSSVLF